MAKTMLIDATHPEETRVAVVDGRKLEEFDVEVASRRPLKGNIYLAKVTRVEPSLQAAFVEYGGNRHGFLAFSEIHPDYYRIPIADREALLRAAAEELGDDDTDDFHHHDHEPDDHDHHHHHDGDDHGGEAHTSSDDHASSEGLADYIGDVAKREQAAPADLMVSESGEFVPSPAEPVDHTSPENPSSGSNGHSNHEDFGHEGAGETIALASRQDVLRGDRQLFDAADSAMDSQQPSETDTAENGEFAPAPQAEIVEVPAPEEVLETVGGEETSIQDDPDADEERAKRRRQRNMRRYKIQEVIKRRQILLVQVTKEERGNKGAALTTYLSLAGRYCVLMPNTDRGGGISRRITSATDRKRLKSIIDDLDAPEGMAVIVRTAGSERSKAEVRRDFEYLLRLWDEIRDVTLRSTAPALIYEEASLIKRSIRDLYTRDIGDIIVSGGEAYMAAKSFMRTLTPSHAKRVQLYRDPSIPLFQRYQIESQLAAIHQPVVQLKSGGYIVINQTEALVAVDVNSGRSTKERNIEETALRTNLEAADEVARQLRLRDLAGLIVIDFIDMEENRNNAAVERRMKEALKNDRARIQIGRISSFGLLEMSRQRLHPSLAEASTEICPHCAGTGRIRSVDSTALHVLRMVEEEITRSYSPGVVVMVPGAVALYILNQKRSALSDLEHRRGVRIYLEADESLIPPDYRLERIKQLAPGEEVQQHQLPPITVVEEDFEVEDEIEVDEDEADVAGEADDAEEATTGDAAGQSGEARGRKRRRRRRTGRGERLRADEFTEATEGAPAVEGSEQPRAIPAPAANDESGVDEDDDGHDDGDEDEGEVAADGDVDGDQPRRRRRRGRRGGRRRSRRPQDEATGEGGDGDTPTEDGNRPEAGPSGDPVHQAWTAGEGDQPSLPDILPVHWQQQSPTLTNTEAAADSSAAATSTVTGETTAEATTQPAGNDAAVADQGNTRRRTRRDDGERPARTRKPRRSRDEVAGEAASAETAVQSNNEQVEAPVENTRPVIVRPPEPTPVQSAPIPTATIEPASPQFVPPSPAADVSGNNGAGTAGDVTVIGEGTPAEDGPKRRGWWRRLME